MTLDARTAAAALSGGTASLTDLRQIVVDFPHLRSAVAAYGPTDEALLGWLGSLHDPVIDAELAKRVPGAGQFAPAQGPSERNSAPRRAAAGPSVRPGRRQGVGGPEPDVTPR